MCREDQLEISREGENIDVHTPQPDESFCTKKNKGKVFPKGIIAAHTEVRGGGPWRSEWSGMVVRWWPAT